MSHRQTIVVIDSDDASRDSIASRLSEKRYIVVESKECAEALTRLHHMETPALIVAEYTMSGLEAVPFVLLGARTDLEERAVALQASGFLNKPFDEAALLATVERLSVCSSAPKTEGRT